MKNKKIYLIAFIIICLSLFCFSLTVGSYDLSINDILEILTGTNSSLIQQNVFIIYAYQEWLWDYLQA